MNKLYLFLIGITLLNSGYTSVQNLNPPKKIIVKGHVKFPENEGRFGLILNKVENGNSKTTIKKIDLDSLNNYNFEIQTDEAGFYELDVYKTNSITFYADDEDLTIDLRGIDTAKVKIKNPPYIFIKGGPKNNVLNMINYVSYQNYQDMIAVSQEQYKASLTECKEWKDYSQSLWENFDTKYDGYIKNIINTYIDYPTVVKAIDVLYWKTDSAFMLDSYDYLAQKFPHLSFIQEAKKDLIERIENEKRMSIGNPAPLFTLPDIKNKMVSLSNFKGKYVLIDFWASWCGPCRQESPLVQKLFLQYKDQLQLISVSIDKDLNAWKKAVKEDNLNGVLLIAQNSEQIQKDYVFSGIPYIVLLDPEGKIVAKNLRGDEMEKTLNHLFKK